MRAFLQEFAAHAEDLKTKQQGMVDFLYRFHFSTLTWNWNEAMTIFVKNSERLADFFLNVTVMYLPGLDCCISLMLIYTQS